MEESILQDKVTGASVTRRLASAPAAIDYGQLSSDYDSKTRREKALEPIYDENNGLLDYLNDAWHSFNNGRLETSISEERGKLALTVYPKQRELDAQIKHLESKKELDQWESKLQNTPKEAEEYQGILQGRNEAYDKYISTLDGYSKIAEANGEKDLNRLYKEREDLSKEEAGYLQSIKEYKEDLDENSKYKISDEFKYREQKSMETASLTDPDFWTHGLPGTLGSSATSWEAQALNLTYNLGLSALALSGAFTGGAGTAAAAALYASGAAVSVGTNIYSRREESMANVFEAKRNNAVAKLDSIGIDETILANLVRETIKANGGDDKSLTDKELVDMAVSGEVKLNNANINNILQESENGLEDVYQKNMALGVSDIAQDAITFIPVGGTFKKISDATLGKVAKAVTTAERSAKAVRRVKAATESLRKMNSVMNSTARKVATKGALKVAGKVSLTAIMEGAEEGAQQVFQEDYKDGNANNSILSNALAIIPAYATVASIITGIDTESKLANDPEFYQNFNSGVALGLFMGGPVQVGQGAVSTYKEAKVTDYMNNVIANQIADKDAFNKATTYTNKIVNNKQEQVLTALEAYKSRLPEGITEADIDEEISHAKSVFGLANSSNNKKFAKQLGISTNSPEYGYLIGLQDYNLNKIKELSDSYKEISSKYQNVLNDAFVNSINKAEENSEVLSSLNDYNATIAKFELDAIEEAKQALPKTNISDKLISALDKRITDLNKTISINEDAKVDYNVLNALSASPETFELVKAKALNLAALDFYKNELSSFTFGEQSDEKTSKINDTFKNINEGRRQTFDVLKQNLSEHNNEVRNAIDEENAAVTKESIEEHEAEVPTTEETKEVPVVETKSEVEPTTKQNEKVDDGAKKTIQQIKEDVANSDKALIWDDEVSEDEDAKTPISSQAPITKEEKTPEQQRPTESEKVDDGEFDSEVSEDDEFDSLFDDYEYYAGENKKSNKTKKNVATKAVEKLENLAPSENDTESDPLLVEIKTKAKLLLEEQMANDFDLWSEVMFFQPDSKTPMDIVVDGKRLDVLPGSELKKVSANEDFIQNSTFEYVVGDSTPKNVEEASVYVIIRYEGKTYATAFRTPSKAAQIAEARINLLSETSSKPLSDAARQVLQEKYEESVALLRENRQRLLFLWNGRSKSGNEAIIPVTVTKSDGTLNASRPNRRAVQNVKGLLPKEITTENTVIGISKGYHDDFRTYSAEDGQLMPNFGGNGDVFLYPKAASGRRVPVLVHKQKVSAYKGFAEVIFDALKALGTPMFKHNGVEYRVDPEVLLTNTIGFGEFTRPFENSRGPYNSKQRFHRQGDGFYLGNRSYSSTEIDANRDAIIAYINDNINLRVGYDTIWSNVKDVLPLETMLQFAKDGELKFGPFVYSKDMLADDSNYRMLDSILSVNGLTSNLEDGVFTLPFFKAHDFQIVSNNLVNEVKSPDPVTPIKSAEPKVETLLNDELQNAANAIGTENVSKDVKAKIESTGYDPFADAFADFEGANKKATESKSKITNKEIQWLRSSVGLTEGELVVYDTWLSGVKEGGMQAMGNMRHDCVSISKLANKGVAYHEGFHRVSLLLLTDKERDYYYGLMAKKLGITTDTLLEQKAIEEALANDFAEFATKSYRHMLYPITKLFRRILRFVKTFGSKSDNQLSDLYNEILNGKFASYSVNEESLKRYKSIYTKDGAWFKVGNVEFEHISLKDYRETVNALLAATFNVNKVELIADAYKISLGNVKAFLSKENTDKLENLTNAQRLARQELYDKFDGVISKELQYQLSKYAIRIIDKESEQDAQNIANGDAAMSDIASHVKSSYEISWRDNALASAKLFIATIPATDQEGKFAHNAATGLPVFVDFKKSWNKVLSVLHSSTSINDLLSKSAAQGKTDKFFALFNAKLNRTKDEYVRTQLLNTINTMYHNMIDITYGASQDSNGNSVNRIFVNDANLKRASRELPILWNGLFLENFFTRSGDSRVINTNKLNSAVEAYKTISGIKDQHKKVSLILSVLNALGINVDIATLNKYFDVVGSKVAPENRVNVVLGYQQGLTSLFQAFEDINSAIQKGEEPTFRRKPINYTSFFSKFEVLKQIAEIHASLNPNTSELTVIGPENTLLYPISSHNYLSQITQKLNVSKSFINDMLNVTYNSGNDGNKKGYGSRLLTHLASNKKIQLNTLVGFRVDKTTDGGRKYSDFSDKEDYAVNVALTQQGHLILPTMGDSTTRNTISGMPLFNGRGGVVVEADGKTFNYIFNSEVTSQMWNYFKAEYATIVKNYNNEKLLELHPERKVKNYHTGSRNGYRFRYFGQLLQNGKLIDLDKYLIEAEEKDKGDLDRPETKKILERINKLISTVESDSSYHTIMNDVLGSLFKEELAYAHDLGVIEFNTMNDVKNLALDESVVNERAELFNGSEKIKKSNAIVDTIANYFANSIMSTIEFEKVYTKDPAYYKWVKDETNNTFSDKTIDKIKRIREVLSTGVIPRTDFESSGKDGDTEFVTGTLNDVKTAANTYEKLQTLADKSFAVNLLREMHNLTDDEAIKIYENPDLFADAKYNDVKDALLSKKDYFKGYSDGKVNQTDASVLISPEFYKQLIKRVDGWTDKLEEAYKLLSDPSNKWMNDLDANLSAMELILKPLKFMYFNDHFDAELGLNVPVFDKMAMFPVFPAFVNGADAQHILDLMNEKNIDMLAFDSAVKVGMKSSEDVYSKDDNGNVIMNPTLGNIKLYKQKYEGLKRQLITDPHHAERQMFVSQAFKAAMGNLREDRIYTLPSSKKQLSGKELKVAFKTAFDALTVKGFERISAKFGIQQKEDGTYDIDYDKLYAALFENARNSDMNVNVLEGLTKHLPLSALSDNNWIETNLSATFNREIVDTRLPGGMFIQMSSIMYNNVTSDKNLQRRLNEVNDDGSMDAIVSLNLLKHLLPKDKTYTFSEARKWLLDNKVIGPEADPIAIGYRIPAQGQSSLAPLKFVDIWPEQLGDTITLPDAFTAQTGSD